jgi:hypothetical protein
MEHFAGLGVSLEETSICIVDNEGRIVVEKRIASHVRLASPYISMRLRLAITSCNFCDTRFV